MFKEKDYLLLWLTTHLKTLTLATMLALTAFATVSTVSNIDLRKTMATVNNV